jgi:hypothetical protein
MGINDSSDSKLDHADSALPQPEGLFDRLIQFSIHNAIWVMLFIVAWIAIGIYSYQKLPIDAVPDITNTQVQVNTSQWFYGIRSGTADYLSHRNCDGRHAENGTNPFYFTLWLIASDHYF